jgi:hypothetical protein
MGLLDSTEGGELIREKVEQRPHGRQQAAT